jgi:hypothetical protein
MSDTKTTKATVELAKSDDGTWLNVEIGGRKASLSLERSPRDPVAGDIFREWCDSHFRPAGPAKKALVLLSECLLAGTVTLILIGTAVDFSAFFTWT